MITNLMSLKRSWHDYNESLIERGRILMDISFLKDHLKKEIREDEMKEK